MAMRTRLLLAGLCLATLPACFQFEVQAQAGYAELSLDGDVGYLNGSTGTATQQTVDSAFGLGDDQGSPFARVELDTGVPVISVSAFIFEDEGNGQLNADFGDLVAGLPVSTEFELTNIKGAYAFEIPLGPVSISPGIAVDYFDLTINARDRIGGGASQDLEIAGPLPLAFLRAEVDLDVVRLVAEGGYMEADIDDVDGSLLDIEAMLLINPVSALELFVGYRHLEIEVDGIVDDDTVDTDITVSGLVLGGGLRF